MASKAYSIVMDQQELVLDYNTRFQKAYYEGGIVDNEGLALRFLISLLLHIQENVQVAWHGRHDDSTSRPTSKRHLNAWSGSSVSKGHKHTTVSYVYHGPKAHHSTEECKKKVLSTTVNKQENNCTYCGRPYTPEHCCQEYQDTKAKKAQQMTNLLRLNTVSCSTLPVTPTTTNHPADEVVDNLTYSMDDLEFESTRTYHCYGQNTSTSQNPYSLTTPIIIQDEHMEGLLDTGAEFSAISLEWHHQAFENSIQ
ncbi:hypothetical protein EC973_005629 [Apophysomyces ossiformis]|uniref:Uncharacterized protein n=1 Tax=Apophysomyces ossiformis TaxID=679940 RepID=A0A8H7ELZ4_9FUNG|nr:hypothetical protein EC973_005629 [Apophysomyces ossiformis]